MGFPDALVGIIGSGIAGFIIVHILLQDGFESVEVLYSPATAPYVAFGLKSTYTCSVAASSS